MDQDQRQQEQQERYRELLEELRTIIPGAQVLFAFLLTVPFASRFSQLDPSGRIVFTVSLISVAAATVLFFAPAAYHRVVGHADREARLRFGVRMALAGLILLAVSITCAIFVVVRFVFGLGPAVGLSAAIGGLAGVTWYLVPFGKRRPSPGRN